MHNTSKDSSAFLLEENDELSPTDLDKLLQLRRNLNKLKGEISSQILSANICLDESRELKIDIDELLGLKDAQSEIKST